MSHPMRLELAASCEKCEHQWTCGIGYYVLPYREKVKCPNCGFEKLEIWQDEETLRLLERKRLGLDSGSKLSTKVEDQQKRIENLEAEVKILKDMIGVQDSKRELVENNVANLIAWAKKREQDFNTIEELAKELEEDYERFKRENK